MEVVPDRFYELYDFAFCWGVPLSNTGLKCSLGMGDSKNIRNDSQSFRPILCKSTEVKWMFNLEGPQNEDYNVNIFGV